MKSFRILLLFVFGCFSLMAQEEVTQDSLAPMPDSLGITPPAIVALSDSTATSDKKEKKSLRGFLKKDYPNPKKAMLLSFAIPGAGQIYNKKYWKAPIALGGTIAMIFVVRENTRTYRFYRDEYKARVDTDTTTIPIPGLERWEDEDIRKERDRWNKFKEMSYIGLILVQALGGVDAFVDAHMAGFEINEDLSMKIKPTFEFTTVSGAALGLSLSFHLNSPTPPQPREFFLR